MPMTGLEEMKAAIEEESRVERAEIDRRAQEQAATIGAEAKAAAAARYQEILSDARQACAGELQRAKTGGEMKIKRLRELPDADYFTVLQTLACSYARKGEGEMLLSQRDLQRLPAGFADTLNSMLKSQGAQVHIGARAAKIDGGFLLVYGDIEVNCSFEALLEASLEQVKDALNRELFA